MINAFYYFSINLFFICLVYSCYFFNFLTALELKFKWWKLLLAAFLFSIIDFLITFTIGLKAEKISIILMTLTIVCPFLWRKSKEPFLKVAGLCIFLTGIHFSFTILCDVISSFIMNKNFYLILICAYLIQIIACLLLNLFLRRKTCQRMIRHLFQNKGVSWLTFISSLLLTGGLIAFFTVYYDYVLAKMSLTSFLLIIYVTIGVVFGLVLAVSSYIRLYKDKLKAAESMLLQQQSYNRVLEDVQKDIRHFQHDYKNILASFYLQLKEGKIEEAQKLLEEKFLLFDQSISHNVKQMNYLNNIEPLDVKSLLMTKMLQMEQKKIQFHVEVVDSIHDFYINSEDLVRCLGILLDNAIEEESLLESEKKIYFVAYKEDSTITIVVKNHLKEEKNLEQITQDGYSTKGKNRGIGLSSYQSILKKYPNVLNRTIISDNQFQQILKLQMN